MAAATARNYDPLHIHQGPGDLWIIGGGVVDSTAPQLTLFTDGSPDSVAHPLSIHLGSFAAATTITVKPKMEDIKIDQADAPVDRYTSELGLAIEADLAQLDPTIMANCLPYAVFSTAVGYNQLTFGGLNSLGSLCVAMIAAKRAVPGKYIVTVLFKAHGTVGLGVTIGRAKAASYKATFAGLADMTRVAGRQTGVLYETK